MINISQLPAMSSTEILNNLRALHMKAFGNGKLSHKESQEINNDLNHLEQEVTKRINQPFSCLKKNIESQNPDDHDVRKTNEAKIMAINIIEKLDPNEITSMDDLDTKISEIIEDIIKKSFG